MTSQAGPSGASGSFIPRPFPPPWLRDVPEAYVVSQLHRLAQNYWSKPETADCTIIVPCEPRSANAPRPPSPDPLKTGPFSTQNSRDSDPQSINARRMVLKLHQDYLSAHSTFMRALLAGSSPFPANAAPSASEPGPSVPRSPPRQPSSHLAAGAFPVHSSRHPRVLPSSRPHHPVILLPVPDSHSFPHLIHYFYFGTFDYMEECLHRGIITWQGVARNVEYLGITRVELKASLGRYHRQWLRPNTPTQGLRTGGGDEEDASDGSESDYSSGSSMSQEDD